MSCIAGNSQRSRTSYLHRLVGLDAHELQCALEVMPRVSMYRGVIDPEALVARRRELDMALHLRAVSSRMYASCVTSADLASSANGDASGTAAAEAVGPSSVT